MAGYALRIANGSRHPGRCGRCHQDITWAILAARGGKSIPLVASPVILRTEKDDRDVVVEVLAFDQIHKCPVPKPKAAADTRTSSTADRRTPSGAGVFSAFTGDRLKQLREAIDAPKPPADPADHQQELF